MVDSTICVSFVTESVIPMEVPVDKAAHYSPYHSHSSLSRECVGSLTDRTTFTAREPTTACVPARDETAKTLVF